MIQAQYAALYSIGGSIGTEVPVPLGSKKGLRRITTDDGRELWGTDSDTTANGYADIIDYTEQGLYEIKPHSAAMLGEVTVGWYISAWNTAVQKGQQPSPYNIYLHPGGKYPPKPGVIVGTDPNDASKWVTAELSAPGVILYGTVRKNTHKRPVPIYVYDWNPNTQKVNPRKGADSAVGVPVYTSPQVLIPMPDSEQAGRVGVVTVCVYALYLGWKALQTTACGPCSLVFP